MREREKAFLGVNSNMAMDLNNDGPRLFVNFSQFYVYKENKFNSGSLGEFAADLNFGMSYFI
jgi:hypothetical protein